MYISPVVEYILVICNFVACDLHLKRRGCSDIRSETYLWPDRQTTKMKFSAAPEKQRSVG